ncbi:LLGL scribble cell polarity complex component 2-like, partial [Nilaparvata lugens]|uniref:LLGL scribble cell polarity complex component 2-like n=1 Tax=Nilaparvata lugens TaxID=108931 RepID=UPI00193D9A69
TSYISLWATIIRCIDGRSRHFYGGVKANKLEETSCNEEGCHATLLGLFEAKLSFSIIIIMSLEVAEFFKRFVSVFAIVVPAIVMAYGGLHTNYRTQLNKITVMRLESSGRNLLLGLEGGNVNLLNVATFEFSSAIIFQDKIVQSVEEDYKINPGAVEAIEEQPGNPDNVLIGNNRGLMVLWNRKTSTAEQTFISSQQLESVSWEADGQQFVSAHNDGSYAYWGCTSSKPQEEPSTPYGPFPCKAITSIVWAHDANQPTQDLLLFSGGMTRASYGDKNTITALRGKHVSEGKHVIFDFTSKIIDFFTISVPDGGKGVSALIVLAEEELVAIDLAGEEWKMLCLPYLVSLHASAITCATYVSDVPADTWHDITQVGRMQNSGLYSDAEWPINGGICEADGDDDGEGKGEEVEVEGSRDILLTGHEDGSVRFWSAGGVALSPLYTFASKQAMHAQDDDDILVEHPVDEAADNGEVEEDEDWPFRKVSSD